MTNAYEDIRYIHYMYFNNEKSRQVAERVRGVSLKNFEIFKNWKHTQLQPAIVNRLVPVFAIILLKQLTYTTSHKHIYLVTHGHYRIIQKYI